jgi:hypothetical protein
MTVDTLGRAFDLYRRTATSRSATLLVLANLIPLVGVLSFGWSLITILVLYWLENGIVGLWNVPKIMLAQGSMLPRLPDLPPAAALAATRSPTAAARLSAVPRVGLAIFFAFHYGMFWLVHGIFVFALPAFAGGVGAGPFGGDLGAGSGGLCLDASGFPVECAAGASGAFGEVVWSSVLIGAIALLLSHGASFFLNYIGRGEYVTATPGGQMAGVYGRVVVLHLTIIFGSFVVAFLGAPIGALLVLVVLKTAFDLGLHLRERRRAGPPLPGPAPSRAPSAVSAVEPGHPE